MSLTVVLPGVLEVTPNESMDAAGGQGGPFTPATKTYTLRNIGEGPFDWAAGSSEGWAGVSHTGGTLEGGESIEVEVSINANANDLDAGSHMSFLSFVNTTYLRGNAFPRLNLEVAQPGSLEVTPGDMLISSGPQGGPFDPITKTFTLINAGGGPIEWKASKVGAWIALSPTDGTLGPAESTTVTARITSFANALAPNTYGSPLSFTNETNGTGDTIRSARLFVTSTLQLTVFTDGDGKGTVTSQPRGIDCGTDCEEDYQEGTRIALEATGDRGSFFSGWRWACSGPDDCEVAMNVDRSVVATFELEIVETGDGIIGARAGAR